MCSSGEPEGGVGKEGTEPGSVGATTVKTGAITATLANAGNTLEGAQAELVLNPLRLAFETKNLKILEPALDCLHVRNYTLHVSFASYLYTTYVNVRLSSDWSFLFVCKSFNYIQESYKSNTNTEQKMQHEGSGSIR